MFSEAFLCIFHFHQDFIKYPFGIPDYVLNRFYIILHLLVSVLWTKAKFGEQGVVVWIRYFPNSLSRSLLGVCLEGTRVCGRAGVSMNACPWSRCRDFKIHMLKTSWFSGLPTCGKALSSQYYSSCLSLLPITSAPLDDNGLVFFYNCKPNKPFLL